MKSILGNMLANKRREKLVVKLATEAARANRPNPARRDCPGSEVLEAVARRQLSGEQLGSAVDHIANCSPCFREYEHLRRSLRSRRTIGFTALAVVFGLAYLASSHLTRPTRPPPVRTPPQLPPPSNPVAPAAPLTVVLDLRSSAPLRGEGESGRPHVTARMPRALLNLRIQLPMGSAEGRYEAGLFSNNQARLSGLDGIAEYRDQVEVLDLSVDTRPLPAGVYELRLRRPGAAWQMYSVRIE